MADLKFDVVVVGGGGSGLAAAVEAARMPSRVLLIEKNPYLGGSTALSVGSITACCTSYQRHLGIQDSAEAFYEDMGLLNRHPGLPCTDNLDLRRRLAQESASTIRWLIDLGAEFFGPMPEPPHRYPRMHNVLPNSGAYIYILAHEARKRGVDIQVGVTAQRLLVEGGRVVGIQAMTSEGRTFSIAASHGVVLATGDYSSNRDLKKTYISPEVAHVEGLNPASTGDGHLMALELGARVVNGDRLIGPAIRFVAPPRKALISRLPPSRLLARTMKLMATWLPAPLMRRVILAFVTTHLSPSTKLFEEGAILVNKEGLRFVNELATPALAMPGQHDGVAFILFDDRVARKFSRWPYFVSTAPGIVYAYLPDYRRNRQDIYTQATTLEDIAHRLQIPEGTLVQTVGEYNRSVDAGRDAAFGRPALGQGLRVPPYYALGPTRAWVVVTDGGLAVTPRCEVLDQSGKPIPGLYAAGSVGQGGVLLEGHGLHLCWAFTSGRAAGRNAASASPLPR